MILFHLLQWEARFQVLQKVRFGRLMVQRKTNESAVSLDKRLNFTAGTKTYCN